MTKTDKVGWFLVRVIGLYLFVVLGIFGPSLLALVAGGFLYWKGLTAVAKA